MRGESISILGFLTVLSASSVFVDAALREVDVVLALSTKHISVVCCESLVAASCAH